MPYARITRHDNIHQVYVGWYHGHVALRALPSGLTHEPAASCIALDHTDSPVELWGLLRGNNSLELSVLSHGLYSFAVKYFLVEQSRLDHASDALAFLSLRVALSVRSKEPQHATPPLYPAARSSPQQTSGYTIHCTSKDSIPYPAPPPKGQCAGWHQPNHWVSCHLPPPPRPKASRS
ncbi:hypothetical protein CONLIGDRAFT_236888 [Coniochaeta ligniaria NRRL 30616]|uniref:Uncharacterized protein n=1 Tax=Coniochaeta ligniaria NRRL 30616 TaxID=1408157 RepID=A0A1J7JVD7_9PEZI|nr:hypothetical protein CONLIGDRAFT_236888 [Coniochaeta ligniaria NRRL 30616]